MDKLLIYQELDGKLRKIDKQLNDSEDKKKGRQLNAFLKEAEDSLRKMEERSRELNQLLSNLNQSYTEKEQTISEYEKSVDKSIDLDEVNYLSKKMSDLAKSISVLDRQAHDVTKEIEDLSAKYENYRSKVPTAQKQYRECRERYDVLVKQRMPEIMQIKAELSKMEKTLNPELLEKFKRLKSQGVYPPFVPLIGNNQCGGCQMDNPTGLVSAIDSKGYIVCENCHRVIYKKEEN